MKPLRFVILILILISPCARAQVVRQAFPDSTKTCVAYTNKLVITTNAARALRITAQNSSASDLWLLVFDRSTNNVPPDGTMPSLPPLKITAGATGGWDYQGVPELFRAGIIVANSTTDRTLTNTSANFFIRVSYDGKDN